MVASPTFPSRRLGGPPLPPHQQLRREKSSPSYKGVAGGALPAASLTLTHHHHHHHAPSLLNDSSSDQPPENTGDNSGGGGGGEASYTPQTYLQQGGDGGGGGGFGTLSVRIDLDAIATNAGLAALKRTIRTIMTRSLSSDASRRQLRDALRVFIAIMLSSAALICVRAVLSFIYSDAAATLWWYQLMVSSGGRMRTDKLALVLCGI